MVYCGKASLGCLSCRKRRIKCDRRQPECTQCVRLSKSCPGYRDQLSLMFRDETVKVEKRVRASWGVDDSSSSVSSSQVSSSSTKTTKRTQAKPRTRSSSPGSTTSSRANMPTPPASVTSASPSSARTSHHGTSSDSGSPISNHTELIKSNVPTNVSQTVGIPGATFQQIITPPSEIGVSFFVKHYLLGYPDEVRRAEELSTLPWFEHPSAQATMAALGLAALGNRSDNKELKRLSTIKYGEALKSTNEILQDPVKNLETAIRTTVMLALYQCVNSSHESHEQARVHLLGCMALIKTAVPIRSVPANGIRGIMQLCYSLLYPCVQSGTTMPEGIFDAVRKGIADGFLPEDELPAVSLIPILARFTELKARARWTAFSDGHDSTATMMRQLLEADEAMAAWEASQQGKWTYQTYADQSLPADAVFHHTYHRYSDVWTSRTWSHYRWARILVNQMLIEFSEQYPLSAAGVVTLAQQDRIQETIRRLAVDVLVSVPTHYKHPSLTWSHLDAIQSHGGAGAGAVGIPHLIFHLQTVACAPGVPYEVWSWAVGIMDMVWRELGMLHAKSLADLSRAHRAKLDQLVPEGILKLEAVPRSVEEV
ncbi:hypothetical protein BD289DRAFT_217123 [Coniella lustricola]|uniref:Zn(2)-C6 fungal-type domain-containing protein n=1 Tax=Coniella lustricola TaxID=2025994 RepID=A0A2T3ABC5_9PEZI|nr:hypothetical protein BD289DRAFT_217123 [Coniella lustricola]